MDFNMLTTYFNTVEKLVKNAGKVKLFNIFKLGIGFLKIVFQTLKECLEESELVRTDSMETRHGRDFTTKADKLSETIITQGIKTAFPDHL